MPKAERWAKGFGLDPKLLYAVVWRESRLCSQVVGSKGEIGLGQIMPSTALALGVHPSYLYDPDWNLYTSAKYLRYLYFRLRDWEKVLMAYNAGIGRVTSGNIPPASVTYARGVLAHYSQLSRGGR